jgi:dynactin complex subunit
MSYTLYKELNSTDSNEELIELKNQIEDLKAELRVKSLKLKDAEFQLSKKSEEFELKLGKLTCDNNTLREKYEK